MLLVADSFCQNPIVDSLEDDLLHYVIQLTPSFKMEVGATVDLNYTNRNTTGADNLIGIALSPSFRNRNLFGGAELLVTSLRAGVEINPTVNSANTRFYNTVDLGAEVSLFLPRFRDITGLYRLAYGKGKRLLTNRFYTSMRERAETRFGIGAEYLLIRGFYDYTQFNARLGYNMRISGTTKYQINHTAVDLLRPNTEPAFDTILMENQFLQRSFGEQFFFSLLFRDIDYQRNGRTNRHGESAAINFNLEVAGAELYAANRIANAINGDNRIFQPLGADYAQYIRTQFDLRYYKEYSETTSLATRFLFNIARPFGFGQAVPYVKQFNAGGANSMRAWSPRGLGPGGFVDSLSLLSRSERSNLLLYQTGDLQLELNLELRYKLFWQLRGALFVDIGNVWTLDYQNEDRRGSQFRFTTLVDNDDGFRHQPFFRQLAIGAGTGIRVDLSYFIFRLDAAIPLRFNYPSERPDNGKLPERLYWNTFKGFRFPGDFTWQLGLGYPF
ncbi:MAG: BamA/TamA family outer membrane protein [Bacteroidota bacterium]